MLNFLFTCFIAASISWFYHVILRDFLFQKWFQYGFNHFGKDQYKGTWKEYLYMPIWGCQYCTSGQLSLWSYLIIFNEYSFLYHIAFITLTTLLTKIIWKYLEQ